MRTSSLVMSVQVFPSLLGSFAHLRPLVAVEREAHVNGHLVRVPANRDRQQGGDERLLLGCRCPSSRVAPSPSARGSGLSTIPSSPRPATPSRPAPPSSALFRPLPLSPTRRPHSASHKCATTRRINRRPLVLVSSTCHVAAGALCTGADRDSAQRSTKRLKGQCGKARAALPS